MSYVIKDFDDEIEYIIDIYKLTLKVNRDGDDLIIESHLIFKAAWVG